MGIATCCSDMADPNSRALVAEKEKEERALMPPPPPRRRQVVLDEDTWTDSLEAIIERDYFPELNKLEGKVEWLEVCVLRMLGSDVLIDHVPFFPSLHVVVTNEMKKLPHTLTN